MLQNMLFTWKGEKHMWMESLSLLTHPQNTCITAGAKSDHDEEPEGYFSFPQGRRELNTWFISSCPKGQLQQRLELEGSQVLNPVGMQLS